MEIDREKKTKTSKHTDRQRQGNKRTQRGTDRETDRGKQTEGIGQTEG